MSFYIKPAILQDPALLQSHGLIEAAAGTGKTFTIAHLVVELLLNNVPIQDILVVTFTDKAASELKTRIRQLLIELINYQSDDPVPQDRNSGWLLTPEAKQQLTYALEDIDLATIATIHGFCNRVLSEYAFENARPFDQVQVSPDEGFRQLFGPFLHQLLAEDTYQHRELLTHVISKKHDYANWLYTNIKSLISINPAVILPEASDRNEKQAWLDFAARFQQTPELVDQIGALNINARSRTSQVEKAQTAHDQLAVTDTQDWIAIREWASQNVFHKTNGLHLFTKDPDDIKFNKKAKDGMLQSLAELSETIQSLIDIGQGLKDAASVPIGGMLLADLFPRWQTYYREQKANRGWFDFDDMITIVADHIAKDKSSLCRELKSRYSHALIDEFQDTDHRQWTIFKAIFLDHDEPEPSRYRIYLIGDPKQAIYSFRGADIHTYLAAAKAVTRQGMKLHLDTNYRSSAPLMSAINTIFRHPSLFQVAGGITYAQDIACGFPQMGTSDQQALTYFIPPEPEGDKRAFFGTYRKQALPAAMAAEIKRLLADPDFKMIDKKAATKQLNPRDVAILVNTRTEAELIAEALRQQQIPHAFYKQAGLFETEQARQLYDVLEAVLHPRSDDALYRAMLSDFFDIPLETLLENRSIPDPIRQQILTWRELAIDQEDFHGFFDALFSDTHVFERLMLLHGDERAITNYRQLADQLLAESTRFDFPQLLTHFHDYRQGRIKTDDDLLRLETEREAVQIMTIHVSKGLQYPVVFVYGGFSQGTGGGGTRYNYHDYYDQQERRVADLSAQHETEHQAERQREAERLYYVALTRAEYKLYVPHFPKAEGEKDAYSSLNGKYAVLRESLETLRQNAPSQVHQIPVTMQEQSTPGVPARVPTTPTGVPAREPTTPPGVPARVPTTPPGVPARDDSSGELHPPGDSAIADSAIADSAIADSAIADSAREPARDGSARDSDIAGSASDHSARDGSARDSAIADPARDSARDLLPPGDSARDHSARDSARDLLPPGDSASKQHPSGASIRDPNTPGVPARDPNPPGHSAIADSARESSARNSAIADSARDGSARNHSARDGSARDHSARDHSARDHSARDHSARDHSTGQAHVLLAPPELPDFDPAVYYKTIARNPVRISSYTKLSRGQKIYREGIEQHRQERAGAEDEIATTPAPDTKLRGRDFGIAVHEVLEEIDALQIANHTSLDSWQQDDTAMRTLTTLLHPHNLADSASDIAPLIWHAATATIPPGIAVAQLPARDRLAEVDFYMYLQARNHKQVYLQGSIDLVYRYQGRYYFADWKSDYLDDYSPDALAAKVETNYRYQFLIYTEATLRWLGITDAASYEQKFGGLLYLFVRGMDQPQHGVYFQRPTWDQTRQQLHDLEHETYD